MTDIFCHKVKTGTSYALIPVNRTDEKEIEKLPKGQPLRVRVTRVRNYQFLKKYFALLNVLFDYWEPPEKHIGEKNFQRFRSDMIILAGYYEQYVRVDGSIRIDPKSISFSAMDEDSFADLYNKTIDAGIKYVVKNFTGDELRSVVTQIEEFD